MIRTSSRLIPLSLVGISLFLGCSSNQPPTTAPPSTAPAAAKSEDANIQEALAKLSDTDRAAAIKQEVCPVSGEKLGSMNVPPKVTIEGQEVFLCCSGCESDLRKEPAKYLAKLKAK